jgi:hypothetical protein
MLAGQVFEICKVAFVHVPIGAYYVIRIKNSDRACCGLSVRCCWPVIN